MCYEMRAIHSAHLSRIKDEVTCMDEVLKNGNDIMSQIKYYCHEADEGIAYQMCQWCLLPVVCVVSFLGLISFV